jgi:GGDEF domain-containing protein
MSSNQDQTALACYLSTVVAIGNCMAEVCPPVGAMYRDRLLKLPRRLGFDATPQALEQSRDALETDLLEYARTASAWVIAGVDHAAMLLNHLSETEETMVASAELQVAFLDDMAEHIVAASEVDDEAQLRTSFKRYAAGLQAYARRARAEKVAASEDLRKRRHDIEAWLAQATTSNFLDAETGILNRKAAEVRIETQLAKQLPFCALVVTWTETDAPLPPSARGQITKELGERLGATIRPYDVIFRWSEDQLLTIFEASGEDIAARVKQISGWLGDGKCVVEIDGKSREVKTHTSVSVVESADGEDRATLMGRLEEAGRQTRSQKPVPIG